MMQVLRGATVVDGTGAPARPTDVVVDGALIAAVGDSTPADRRDAEVIDLDGLVLAPGFVDPHTHYDAQVLWDPGLTPSPWHGVTTVLMGNCGIGLAPARDDQHEELLHTLVSVEGMKAAALRAGIVWGFGSFADYLDAVVRTGPRCNVAALVAHNPLRLSVMGAAALEDEASDDQLRALRRALDDALAAGAFGFSTTRSPFHSNVDGTPVPSRVAAPGELDVLFGAVAGAGHGLIEAAAGGELSLDDFPPLAQRTGRPVTSTGFSTEVGVGRGPALLDRFDSLKPPGTPGRFWPQVACRPITVQLSLVEPFPLVPLPSFKEVVAVPPDRRAAVYADPAWRDRARPEVAGSRQFRYDKTTVAETVRHRDLVGGPTLAELAARHGADPFDLMVDLALAEDLGTRFLVVVANDTPDRLAEALRDPRVVVGLSDAGAHADMLCDACYTTELLGHWARDAGVLTLEEAVWRLSGQPAEMLGLTDRGRIAPGLAADLVAFDAASVAALAPERVWDLPAGADRLVARAQGIEQVWVNGTVIHRHGADVEDARPGCVLRSR